jgi:aminoacrylate hydrolase
MEGSIAHADDELMPQAVAEARLRMLFGHDRLNDLERIAAPTLVLGASDDMIVPMSHSREIAARIPGARLVETSGGHFFPQTASAFFADCVIGFLQGENYD